MIISLLIFLSFTSSHIFLGLMTAELRRPWLRFLGNVLIPGAMTDAKLEPINGDPEPALDLALRSCLGS